MFETWLIFPQYMKQANNRSATFIWSILYLEMQLNQWRSFMHFQYSGHFFILPFMSL